MKKISLSQTVLVVLFLLGTTVAYSQISDNTTAAVDFSKTIKKDFRVAAAAAAPNEKVLSSFNTLFGNARNVIWTTYGKNLPYVYFETPEKTHRAAFDKNARLVYTLSYYHEEQLPYTVLFQVKDAYYGKSIFSVTEVNVSDKTAYLIILEDKTTWRHIKVLDGEITEEKLMIKG